MERWQEATQKEELSAQRQSRRKLLALECTIY